MHHLLTVGATDGDIGNIFGHAFAAYSTTTGAGDKIKIEGLWGFYAETSSRRVPVLTDLKEWLFGLNIELTGNHGKLINEEMRRLRLVGNEVTEDQAVFPEIQGRVRDVRVLADGSIVALTDEGDVFHITR